MADKNKQSGLTDIPYVEIPPVNVSENINATSGTIAGEKIALGQTESGEGNNAIGKITERGNEYYYVGAPKAALILLGQLRQRTGVSEYGIWIGETGQYLKYSVVDGLVLVGCGIQAGNIHIPDKNTTDDSFHVDGVGNLWVGCTETDFTADHKNAKAYILKNGDAYFGNAEMRNWKYCPYCSEKLY